MTKAKFDKLLPIRIQAMEMAIKIGQIDEVVMKDDSDFNFEVTASRILIYLMTGTFPKDK